MGQGGTLQLINGTPYPWSRTYQHSYQMTHWDFPTTIQPGQSANVYVEWQQKFFSSQKNDAGEATYSIQGTSSSFQIQARSASDVLPQFNLQVYFQSLTTPNNAQGSTLNLGWTHNGYMTFVLAGRPSVGFWSTNGPADWMQRSLPTIGFRSLKQVSIPGTHDAGMSSLTSDTLFGGDCNSVTQKQGILGQLSLGSRYFDIRPVISNGQFYLGHYGDIDQIHSWQGCNGQSVDSLINDINTFTNSYNELIILDVSHDLDADSGPSNYTSSTQAQYNALMTKMLNINHLFVAPNPTSADLTKMRINQFIGAGQPAVVVIIDVSIAVDPFYNTRGFYNWWQLNTYNSYANTPNVTTMITDQLSKMSQQSGNYFLLSWTLTQDSTQAATCLFDPLQTTLLDLAAEAYPQLFSQLLPATSARNFPNVIYVDDMVDTNVAALAMAVNTLYTSGS